MSIPDPLLSMEQCIRQGRGGGRGSPGQGCRWSRRSVVGHKPARTVSKKNRCYKREIDCGLQMMINGEPGESLRAAVSEEPAGEAASGRDGLPLQPVRTLSQQQQRQRQS